MVAISDCRTPSDYAVAIPLLFDKLPINWGDWKDQKVLLKVNLVCGRPHPYTTHPDLVLAVGKAIEKVCEDVDLAVIEGSPAGATFMYLKHGYTNLPWYLIDIDTRPSYYISKIQDPVLPEVHLPSCLQDARLVSIAVGKQHSELNFTGCAKNLIGLPPTHMYSNNKLHKDKLHEKDINGAITALNKHKPIDLAILDLSIGVVRDHIDGEQCNPPIQKLLVGDDAFAVDREGCKLMGINPQEIVHLN